MADEVPQANSTDLAQATRAMLEARGAPRTAENYNRAMLAILRGQETTDFDAALDQYAGGSRGASGGGGSNRRGANARSSDGGTTTGERSTAPTPSGTPTTGGTRRPRPDPGNRPTVTSSTHENNPPETATAGDANRTEAQGFRGVTGRPSTVVSDVTSDLPGTGLDLTGERRTATAQGTPRGSTPRTVPGTSQVSGNQATTTRTATAATPPASDVTGTPEPAPRAPSFRESLTAQGMLNEEGGLNTEDPVTRGVTEALLGSRGPNFFRGPQAGTALTAPVAPRGGPPAGRGPDATAAPMPGGPDGRIVLNPQLPPPPTYLPGASGAPALPGGAAPGALPSAARAPTLAPPPAGPPGLPSPMGPPVPSGALPPGVIPLQQGTQATRMGTARPIGQPRLQSDRGNVGRQQDTAAARLRAILMSRGKPGY